MLDPTNVKKCMGNRLDSVVDSDAELRFSPVSARIFELLGQTFRPVQRIIWTLNPVQVRFSVLNLKICQIRKEFKQKSLPEPEKGFGSLGGVPSQPFSTLDQNQTSPLRFHQQKNHVVNGLQTRSSNSMRPSRCATTWMNMQIRRRCGTVADSTIKSRNLLTSGSNELQADWVPPGDPWYYPFVYTSGTLLWRRSSSIESQAVRCWSTFTNYNNLRAALT